MKKVAFLTFLSLVSQIMLYSQSVIGSGVFVNDTGKETIFWTMGEFVSETFKSNSNILTQGFYQANFSSSTNNKNILELDNILIFPNPFKSHLFIKSGIDKELSYQLLTITGIVIKRGTVSINKSSLILNNIPNGLYLLAIQENDITIKTWQIIKN